MQETQVLSLDQEDALKQGIGKFHGRGAWWALVHGAAKESDVTEPLDFTGDLGWKKDF